MDDSSKIRLLVVTEASLTGAPVLLLNVLSLLQDSDKFQIKVLIKRHDSLVPEFKRRFKTYVLKGRYYQIEKANFLVKIVRLLSSILNRFLYYPGFLSTDVILSNTIVNGTILNELKPIKRKVICYVHELETLITSWPNKKDIKFSLRESKLFIAPSEIILSNLVNNHGISKEKTRKFTTYVPFPKEGYSEEKKLSLRKKFIDDNRLPHDAFLVVAMGTADERKGIDLFLDTVASVSRTNKEIFFIWIGPFANKQIEEYVYKRQRDETGLSELIFTGPVNPGYENLYPFDVFFLSSREDPYPLVVLEAAAVKIPTICFGGSGGIVEFVKDGAGWIVDDFSVKRVSDTIQLLHSNPSMVAKAGEIAYSRFKKEHSDEEKTKKEFQEIINAVR